MLERVGSPIFVNEIEKRRLNRERIAQEAIVPDYKKLIRKNTITRTQREIELIKAPTVDEKLGTKQSF